MLSKQTKVICMILSIGLENRDNRQKLQREAVQMKGDRWIMIVKKEEELTQSLHVHQTCTVCWWLL